MEHLICASWRWFISPWLPSGWNIWPPPPPVRVSEIYHHDYQYSVSINFFKILSLNGIIPLLFWNTRPSNLKCVAYLQCVAVNNLFQDSDEEVAPQATNQGFQFGTPQQVPVGGFHFWVDGNLLHAVYMFSSTIRKITERPRDLLFGVLQLAVSVEILVFAILTCKWSVLWKLHFVQIKIKKRIC